MPAPEGVCGDRGLPGPCASSLEGVSFPAQASSRRQSRLPVLRGSHQPPDSEQLSSVAVAWEGLVPQWESLAGVWQRELQRTAVVCVCVGGEQDRRPPYRPVQSAGWAELMDSPPMPTVIAGSGARAWDLPGRSFCLLSVSAPFLYPRPLCALVISQAMDSLMKMEWPGWWPRAACSCSPCLCNGEVLVMMGTQLPTSPGETRHKLTQGHTAVRQQTLA